MRIPITKIISVMIFIGVSHIIYVQLKEFHERILTLQSNAKKAALQESLTGSILRQFEPAAIRNGNMYAANTSITGKSLFILFTAWDKKKTSADMKRLIIRQWQTLYSTSLLLFTSSQPGADQIKNTLWSSLPIPRTFNECSNYPILPAMFLAAMRERNAYFYGYAHPDIVFGNGLRKTLESIRISQSWLTKPLLIIGKHSQFDGSSKSFPDWKIISPLEVSKLANDGKLSSSADYFISNSLFPWNLVPEMTIGFPLAAELLVSWTLQRDITVIDATNTIQAVSVAHKQKLGANVDKMCNERKIPMILKKNDVVLKGQIDCAILETHGPTLKRTQVPSIHIKSRKPNDICKDTSPADSKHMK